MYEMFWHLIKSGAKNLVTNFEELYEKNLPNETLILGEGIKLAPEIGVDELHCILRMSCNVNEFS